MISLVLADYTNMRGIIDCILDDVLAPHVSLNNSNGSVTSYFHVSIIVHSGSNDHLQLRNLIHGNMLSLSSKKERNRKVSLKTGIIGIDNEMVIDRLMQHFYVALQYFYITN